jgi:hypothetical protein
MIDAKAKANELHECLAKAEAIIRTLKRTAAAGSSEDIAARLAIVADYVDRAQGHTAEISHGMYFAVQHTACARVLRDYCDTGAE